MSTADRVIKNTFWLYAKMGLTMFVSLYTTRLILNSLGNSDFGIYNIVGGAIAMLGFLNAAMAGATQRFMSYAEGEGKKEKQKYIFNISVVLHFIISLIVGVVLIIAGWFFFNGILNIPVDRIEAAKVVYGSMIVSTMLTVMNVPYDAVMNAHENMRYYAIVGILESLMKLAIAFVCVYATGDKLIVYGILMAVIPLITLTIMKVYCHRHYEECVVRPYKYWNKGLMREMTSFAGWNLAGSMGSIVGNYGNAIVLNSFFGTLLNAALGIANQLNGMLLVFSNNMMKALTPVIVKKEGEGDRLKMLEYSLVGCRFSYLLFAMFCLPCFVEAPFILKLWLKDYPEWTVFFMRYQIVRTLLEQTIITLGTTLSATGKIKEVNLAGFFIQLLPILILSACFSLGASPKWYNPIVIIDMVFVLGSVRLYYCKKYCGLSILKYLKEILLPCILLSFLIVVSGFLLQSLMGEGFIRLIVIILFMNVILLILFYHIISIDERNILKSIGTKIIYKIYKNADGRYCL